MAPFRVILPEPPKLITDPNELRLTVDPSGDDVKTYAPERTMACTPVFARTQFPDNVTATIFLAGPTPRDPSVPSWRPEAIAMLDAAGFKGHVFVPEDEGFTFNDWDGEFPYEKQVEWEEEALNRADCILFWVPREMGTMPALTTNDEYGFWKNSGKIIFAAPPDAEKVRYQRHYAAKNSVPVFDSLEAACAAAVAKTAQGAEREGGECQVPLMVWNTTSFQSWYAALKEAGNRLDGARLLWSFRVGPKKDIVFSWVLHVNVFVASEQRRKVNEFVFARTDISSVVLFHRRDDADVGDAEVVLVAEFRSPVRNSQGMVIELPGGSAADSTEKTLTVACSEVHEETGFVLDPSRLRPLGSRQLAATLCTHHAHTYVAELTSEEMQYFRDVKGKTFGDEASTERCYPQVFTIAEALASQSIDWSTLGMIYAAVTDVG